MRLGGGLGTTLTLRNANASEDGPPTILSEAIGDLDASGWVAGTWVNAGTAGAELDAVLTVGDPKHVVPAKVGDAIRVLSTDPAFEDQHAFAIDSPLFDWPDTGGRTFAFDYTELDHGDPDESAKVVWKYPASDLPTSEEGWVFENVPQVGGLLTAGHNGAGFLAAAWAPGIVGVRRRAILVVDRATESLAVYRNGVALVPLFTTGPLSGSAATAAPLFIGADNDYFRLVVIDRALDAAEAAALDAELAA